MMAAQTRRAGTTKRARDQVGTHQGGLILAFGASASVSGGGGGASIPPRYQEGCGAPRSTGPAGW